MLSEVKQAPIISLLLGYPVLPRAHQALVRKLFRVRTLFCHKVSKFNYNKRILYNSSSSSSKTSISSLLQLNTQLILTGVNKHKDKV